MASVSRTAAVTKVVIDKPAGFTLHLSEAEAIALACVMSRVGGDPEKSDRKHTQAIYDALRDSGLYYREYPANDALSGSLVFDH